MLFFKMCSIKAHPLEVPSIWLIDTIIDHKSLIRIDELRRNRGMKLIGILSFFYWGLQQKFVIHQHAFNVKKIYKSQKIKQKCHKPFFGARIVDARG